MSTQDPNAPAQGGDETVVTPAAPTPAPSVAATEVTPQAASQDDTVTVKKSDWDAMTARQSALDKQENRVNRKLAKAGMAPSGHFKQPVANAPAAPTPTGDDDDGMIEDRKAERGLLGLALKPEFREALDADPTFRELLTRNPLGVLPIYAADAFDAEDAIGLVTEELERRAAAVKAAAPTTPAPAPVVAPASVEVPPRGAVNMSDGAVAEEGKDDQEYKDAVKGGSVKDIAAGLRHRLSSRGKQRA